MDRDRFPPALVGALVFSGLAMIILFGSLALTFFGVEGPDRVLSKYTGPWGWMPYVIAIDAVLSIRKGKRARALHLVRVGLIIGIIAGLADLAIHGWASNISFFIYSPWRFVWCWVIPAIWLSLLQSRGVRDWARTEKPVVASE